MYYLVIFGKIKIINWCHRHAWLDMRHINWLRLGHLLIPSPFYISCHFKLTFKPSTSILFGGYRWWPGQMKHVLGPQYANYSTSPIKYKHLDSHLFIAGKLNVVNSKKICEDERICRLSILRDSLQYGVLWVACNSQVTCCYLNRNWVRFKNIE